VVCGCGLIFIAEFVLVPVLVLVLVPMKFSRVLFLKYTVYWCFYGGVVADSLLDTQKFVETCDTSEYHLTSPDSAFPYHIDSLSFDPDFADVKKWYDIGLKECNNYLELHAKDLSTTPVSDPLTHHPPKAQVRTCRGNALMYQSTGLLVWAFGPISKCPPYSKCWFGFLTCGKTNYCCCNCKQCNSITQAISTMQKLNNYFLRSMQHMLTLCNYMMVTRAFPPSKTGPSPHFTSIPAWSDMKQLYPKRNIQPFL
jgi:hypothetical protein